MYRKSAFALTAVAALVTVLFPSMAGAWSFTYKPRIAVYQNVRLENNLAASAWSTDCANPHMLQPAPGEYGHWSSVRLTPERYPFILDSIAYDIVTDHAHGCYARTPHEVVVWVGNSQIPDAVPEVLAVFDGPVDTIPETGGPHRAIIRLDDPITLQAGEYLFISIEMAKEGSEMVCLPTCSGIGYTPDANFWSNSTQTPYSWQALEEFFGSATGDTRVMAYGRQFAFWYYY